MHEPKYLGHKGKEKAEARSGLTYNPALCVCIHVSVYLPVSTGVPVFPSACPYSGSHVPGTWWAVLGTA